MGQFFLQKKTKKTLKKTEKAPGRSPKNPPCGGALSLPLPPRSLGPRSSAPRKTPSVVSPLPKSVSPKSRAPGVPHLPPQSWRPGALSPLTSESTYWAPAPSARRRPPPSTPHPPMPVFSPPFHPPLPRPPPLNRPLFPQFAGFFLPRGWERGGERKRGDKVLTGGEGNQC